MIGQESHEPTKSKSRRMFTVEEDRLIVSYIQRVGRVDFPAIAAQLPGRTTRQVRDRYKSYLRPDITNKPWTHEEDRLLIQKHAEYGPRWSRIQAYFPDRSTVNIKNRWASIGKLQKENNKEKTFIQPTVSMVTQPFNDWSFEEFTHPTDVFSFHYNHENDSWM